MPFIPVQAKIILSLLALLFVSAYSYRQGGRAAKLDCAQEKIEAQAAMGAALEAERLRSAEANESLRRELAKPKPGRGIREVVRNVPSDCRVDPAVADSVRQAVQRANQAAAAK